MWFKLELDVASLLSKPRTARITVSLAREIRVYVQLAA